jgi:Ca2+-binding RTX toxin-like protein
MDRTGGGLMPLVNGTPGDDSLVGGDTGDSIYGRAGDDVLQGGSGNDYIDGEDGTDILYGGDGDDGLLNTSDSSIPGAENDQMYGQGGNDNLYLYVTTTEPETVVMDGGAGDDRVHFDGWWYNHHVTLAGGDGNDTILCYGAATALIDAGSGDDILILSFSEVMTSATVALGTGKDLVQITSASFGRSEVPVAVHFTDFAGGAAGDRLSFDSAMRYLDGWDRISNPFATGHLALTQRAGVGAVLSMDVDGGGDELLDFVVFQGVDAATLGAFNIGWNADGSVGPGLVLDGTAGADAFLGSGDGDLLRGLAGDDRLIASAGNDVAEGGAGDDVLDGGWGDDRLYGGANNDQLFDVAGGDDEFYGGDGNDILEAQRDYVAAHSVVLLDGGEGNDALGYGPLNQTPYRRYVDDVTLLGGNGDDRIDVTWASSAVIDAGAGNDTLYLTASTTTYTITLGTGSDTIDLWHSGSPGSMIVTDFETGESGDRLDIDGYFGNRSGDMPAGTHPYAAGYARVVQRGADAVVQADRDGPSGSGGFVDLVVLQNRDANALTTHNLGGHSHIVGTAAGETLVGTGAAEVIRGLGGNDTLQAGSGNDLLDGGIGNDTLTGGLGNDTYYVDSAGDAINELAGQGTDRVFTGVSYTLAAQLEQLAASDAAGTAALTLSGNATANAITGNAGANVLDGRGGADVMTGLGGDDWYFVDSAGDVVVELANDPGNPLDGIAPGTAEGVNDRVFASVSYTLGAAAHVERLTTDNNAGTAAINLTGNALANLIYGNAGANVLNGAGGADTLVGLGGDDWYYVDDAGDAVSEAAGGGNDRIVTGVSYAMGAGVHVERLVTSDNAGFHEVSLTGNELANLVYGNAGNNVLDGRAGNDTLVGLDGFDTLVGGLGNDILSGGLGDDLYHVDSVGDVVLELAGEGSVDRVLASVSYVLGAGVDVELLTTNNNGGTAAINLTGNALAQTIYGNAGANVLDGRAGADTLIGLAGDDWYYVDDAGDYVMEMGGGGTDRVLASVSYSMVWADNVELLTTSNNAGTAAINLTGSYSANTIYGNAGANVLDGKQGADVLVGLGGADTFAFTTAIGYGNIDTISGFSVADDTIALDHAVFTGLPIGPLAAGALAIGPAATQLDDRIVYNAATGALLFDADGFEGVPAIQFATLAPGLALTGADFVVV